MAARWRIVGTCAAALAALGPPSLAAQPADSLVVAVEGGRVRGTAADGVASWRGIPYAAPPVGDLRWRVPQPVRPWSDVRDAAAFGAPCAQVGEPASSEDCLTLNVWRPLARDTAPLAVMVWIHGGALVHGSAARHDGAALARQGVVVVSMNYRLGRFGFFAHPALSAEAPGDVRGNYGHMDQNAALRWVRRNVAAFGGDPRRVTIFGESAGGGAVLAHLASPLSRGLFHRAILQSPGMPTARATVIPLTELADAERAGVEFARTAGIDGEGPAALAALRALPAAALLKGASGPAALAAFAASRILPGLPGAIRDGRFLVDAPEQAVAARRQALVPLLVGANDRDLALGAARTSEVLFADFGADSAEARRRYDPRGDQPIEELVQRVHSDRLFAEPARRLADEHARGGAPTWLYRFGYVAVSHRGSHLGALHALEIPFVFNTPQALGTGVSATDREVADLASGYWVSFAKTGDPNGDGRPAWPRHQAGLDRLLQFTNAGVVVGTDPLAPRLDLWQRRWGREAQATPAILTGRQ